jgi:hypothetical protein
LLGKEKVDFITESDEIDVHKDGTFRAIRFLVENRPIRLNDLKIYFGNGEVKDERIDSEMEAGSFSRIIDLPGNKRRIEKIEFHYRTVGTIFKGRATVKVYGRH